MSSQDPRQPRDLQGLLRYSIEAGAAENSSESTQQTTASSVQPLGPERRQWLEEALQAMTVNVVELMQNSLKILHEGGDSESDIASQEQALDQLLDWAENIDVAIDFHKIGGFQTIIPCLNNPHAGIRSRTAELIGGLTQNNAYFHRADIKEELVPKLLRLLDTDSDMTVRIKALYGLSCLIRQNPAAQKEFIENDGFSVLLRAMQTDVEKLKIKSAFLLTSLCNEESSYKDILYNMGFVEQLVALIQREHEPTHEHIISALFSLANKHEKSILECQRPELNLKNTLRQRINFLNGKEESKEEIGYCQDLLDLCFKNTSNDETYIR